MVFIKHPTQNAALEISRYGEIKPCTVNLTHLDFYLTPHDPEKERGEPNYIIEFPDQEERDRWFIDFLNRNTNI